MNEDMKDKSVPYIVYESALARMERTIKKLWILCIILLAIIIGSNIAWLYYENQFEDVVTTVTQEVESDRNGNAIINDGIHINDGESETD